MNNIKKRGFVAKLSPRAQMAFAASCVERSIIIGSLFSEKVRDQKKLLEEGLEIAWKYAEGFDFDYQKDVFATHQLLAKTAPDLDQSNADEVFLYVISGVARLLIILEKPEKSSEAAVSAAGCMLNLVGLVYSDPVVAESAEQKWQETALIVLKNHKKKPITRNMFKNIDIPNYGKERSLFSKQKK